MTNEDDVVAGVVRDLLTHVNQEDRDGAWHSLVELGPIALPHLARAFENTSDVNLRTFILGVVDQYRTADALPLLTCALASEIDALWKAALDALVSLGGAGARRAIHQAMNVAPQGKREWLEEAAFQVSESPE
jgi:hypothetical protein